MADGRRPELRLVSTQAPVKNKPEKKRSSPSSSSIVIEVERGQLRESLVNATSPEDALALLGALALALVQVVRASKGV